MTDLQLIILSASIMKAGKTGTSGSAGDLIDDAQKLLMEAYKRELGHASHVAYRENCFICQMNELLKQSQVNAPRIQQVKPS